MNNRPALGTADRAARRYRLVAVVVAIALLAFTAMSAFAQGGITASNAKVESHFSNYIRFSVTLQSDADINSAIVFAKYNTGDNVSTTTRGTTAVTSGKTVTAVFTRTLTRGDLVPGADIQYYWQATDSAGHSLKTEPSDYVYLDDRFDFQSLNKPIGKGSVTVYWYGAPQSYGQKRLDVVVAAIQKLETQIGVELQTNANIFLYRTREDMLAALPNKTPTVEAQLVVLGELASPNTVFLLGSDPGIDSTTAHELTHLVVHLATNNPLIGGVSLPAWLDEGLAVYNQPAPDSSYISALDRATRTNSLISVRSISAVPGQPDQVLLFYGEGYSVVNYLVKTQGKDKMLQLLSVFKRGSSVDDALKEVYGFGVQELDSSWRASLGAPSSAVNTPAPQPSVPPGAVAPNTPAPVSPPAPSTLPFNCACFSGFAFVFLWWFIRRH
jgi:hypothetical protein